MSWNIEQIIGYRYLCVSGHWTDHRTDCWIQWINLTVVRSDSFIIVSLYVLQCSKPISMQRHNNKRFISIFNFDCSHLTLKKGLKVKSDHARIFPAHDFLYVGLPSHTSRTNNKRVISTFNFGYPRLTLKEGPKVNSVHTRKFPANDFLYAGLPSQTSRTNNK